MKFRRKGVIALTAALYVALFASAAMAEINDDSTLRQAISEASDGGTVILNGAIELDDTTGAIVIDKNITLDLNGYRLSRESNKDTLTHVIEVKNDATLTINDSSAEQSGQIVSTNSLPERARGIRIGDSTTSTSTGKGGEVILNGGTIVADTNLGYGVVMYANCDKDAVEDKENDNREAVPVKFTMNGGAIKTDGYGIVPFGLECDIIINDGKIEVGNGPAISGSASHLGMGGTKITINGGELIAENDAAIYQSQLGTITVTGGTITGGDGIQMKSGTLNVTGGTITATGAFNKEYDDGEDGAVITGAALSLLSDGNAGSSYPGDINVIISGGTLSSQNGYAVVEAAVGKADSKFEALEIQGGTFIGAKDKNVISMTNATNDNITITGGTFSSDLSACEGLDTLTNLPQTATDDSGNYYVVVNATVIAFKTETFELAMNETVVLEVVFTPDNTTEKALTWSSSNEEVAKVDPTTGEITPVAPGTTTITAALADNDSVYASCTVTVTEEEVEPTPPITSDDVKPQPSGSGGGGCSAGFGALALLAALPLLRMRKK